MNLRSVLLVSALAAAGAANAVTLTVFNFNDAINASGGTPSAANTAALFSSDRNDASVLSSSLSSSFEATAITNFGGSVVNADGGDVAGQALALQGGTQGGTTGAFTYANNGGRLDLTISAVSGDKFAFSQLSFAGQRTTTGFNSNVFSYSIDGGSTFVSLGSIATLPTAFAAQTLDLSNIPLTSSVIIRETLDGATSAAGNNRIDNLIVTGNVQAVPEPSAFAALGLGVVAILRRRRSAK